MVFYTPTKGWKYDPLPAIGREDTQTSSNLATGIKAKHPTH